MKDVIIKGKRMRHELITLLVCFIIANLLNVYAILSYHAHSSEMITSIFYVLVFSIALYVAWSLVRLLCYGIKRIFTNNKQHKKQAS